MRKNTKNVVDSDVKAAEAFVPDVQEICDEDKALESANVDNSAEKEIISNEQDSSCDDYEALENNVVATAIESIFSEPYFDPRGECGWIQPMLKLSYSICPSTPTVEMQKAAITRLTETMENNMKAGYGHNLKNSFELKQAILGKDTVTFIGEVHEYHEPLLEIQFLLRECWEHASQEVGAQSKSECKGMEIILN